MKKGKNQKEGQYCLAQYLTLMVPRRTLTGRNVKLEEGVERMWLFLGVEEDTIAQELDIMVLLDYFWTVSRTWDITGKL
jgi:hypothetical protein